MASPHTPPAWRRAFLRELARSGNVAMAAHKSGVHFSNAYRVRQANAAFALSWDRALDAARVRLGGAGPAAGLPCPQPLPQGGGGTCAGEAASPPCLDAGEVVRASQAGRPCIARAGAGQWCSGREQAFLAALGASANVRAAARAAGVSTQAVYSRRRTWPAFAEAWDAAKAEGYARLEMLLLHAATSTLDPEEVAEAAFADACAAPEMSIDQAMKLFFHRADRERAAARPPHGRLRQEPDIEAVRASILRKMDALDLAEAGRAGPIGAGGDETGAG